jgi:hypothetical protein
MDYACILHELTLDSSISGDLRLRQNQVRRLIMRLKHSLESRHPSTFLIPSFAHSLKELSQTRLDI